MKYKTFGDLALEQKTLDLVLKKLAIDYKLKAEIIIKVRNFLTSTKKDNTWNKKSGELMLELAKIFAECIKEYDTLIALQKIEYKVKK